MGSNIRYRQDHLEIIINFGIKLICSCFAIDILSETMRWMGETRLYVAALYFILKGASYAGKLSFVPVKPQQNGVDIEAGSKSFTLPPITEPFDDEDVQIIEDDFKLVWIVQTSHSTGSVKSGPNVELDDGVFTIFVIRSGSRCEMLSLLLMMDDGNHINHSRVEVYKVTKFRLEPKTTKGIYSLDGEVVEYGPIQGVIKPSHAKVSSTFRSYKINSLL